MKHSVLRIPLAVILVNVHGFWDPLRALIKSAIQVGFIRESSQGIVVFIDGPADDAQHASYDWGAAALFELEHWGGAPPGFYRWEEGSSSTAKSEPRPTLDQS